MTSDNKSKSFNIQQQHKFFLYPICRVKTESKGGSGTVIYCEKNKKGEYTTFVLTNAHVISDAIHTKKKWDSVLKKKIEREFVDIVSVELFDYVKVSKVNSSNSFNAHIVCYDKDHDLAILRLDNPKKVDNVASIISKKDIESRLKLFENIVMCGCSLLHDPLPSEGIVTSIRETLDNRAYAMMNGDMIFGNCLSADTLISMGDQSVKSINEVKKGDTIWGYFPDSGLAKSTVEEVIESGVKTVYSIKTKSRSIKASNNHPLLVMETIKDFSRRNINGLVWKQIKDIKQGDIIAVLDNLPARENNKLNFSNVLGQEKARDYSIKKDFMRLVGCFLGDGFIRVLGNRNEFGLCLYDKKVRDKYCSIINNIFDIDVRDSYMDNSDEKKGGISFSNKAIASIFNDIGMNKKSHEKYIPDWIMSLTDDLKLAFIEGYIDSDGSINTSGSWRFECTSQAIINSLRMMCIHMGYSVSNIWTRHRIVKEICGKLLKSNKRTWGVEIYPSTIKSKNCFYRGNRIDYPGLVLEKVTSIDELDKEKTYDLKIRDFHNFFANGVLVHNSGGAIFIKRTGEFIGVPSAVRTMEYGFSTQVMTFMGYFTHPDRLYEFFDEQCFQFIYNKNKTYEDALKERKKKMNKALYSQVEEE